MARRELHATRSASGVLGNLRSAYDTALSSNDAKTQQKLFEAQLKHLKSTTPISPTSFLDILSEMKVASGMTGFKSHLPWQQNNPALQEFENQASIINALTPAEKKDVALVKIASKKRVARQLGMEISAVEGVLSHVEGLRKVQRWLRRHLQNGGTEPRSAEEMQRMYLVKNAARGVGRARPGVKGGMSKKGSSKF